MTLKEAYQLLDEAPKSDKPSRLNKFLTESQAVEIVRNAVATLGQPHNQPCQLDEHIDPLAEKRVHQVCKNQVRPNY